MIGECSSSTALARRLLARSHRISREQRTHPLSRSLSVEKPYVDLGFPGKVALLNPSFRRPSIKVHAPTAPMEAAPDGPTSPCVGQSCNQMAHLHSSSSFINGPKGTGPYRPDQDLNKFEPVFRMTPVGARYADNGRTCSNLFTLRVCQADSEPGPRPAGSHLRAVEVATAQGLAQCR